MGGQHTGSDDVTSKATVRKRKSDSDESPVEFCRRAWQDATCGILSPISANLIYIMKLGKDDEKEVLEIVQHLFSLLFKPAHRILID